MNGDVIYELSQVLQLSSSYSLKTNELSEEINQIFFEGDRIWLVNWLVVEFGDERIDLF